MPRDPVPARGRVGWVGPVVRAPDRLSHTDMERRRFCDYELVTSLYWPCELILNRNHFAPTRSPWASNLIG